MRRGNEKYFQTLVRSSRLLLHYNYNLVFSQLGHSRKNELRIKALPLSKFSSEHFTSTPLSRLEMLTWDLRLDNLQVQWKGLRWAWRRNTGSANYWQHHISWALVRPSRFLLVMLKPVTGHSVLATEGLLSCDSPNSWFGRPVFTSKEPARSCVPAWRHPKIMINQNPQVQADAIWNDLSGETYYLYTRLCLLLRLKMGEHRH